MTFNRALQKYRERAADVFHWPDFSRSTEKNGVWHLRDSLCNPLALVDKSGHVLIYDVDPKSKTNSFTRSWRRNALTFAEAAATYSKLFDGSPCEEKSVVRAGRYRLIDVDGHLLGVVFPDRSILTGKIACTLGV